MGSAVRMFDVERFVPRDSFDVIISLLSVALFFIGGTLGVMTIYLGLSGVGIVVAILTILLGFLVDELRGLR